MKNLPFLHALLFFVVASCAASVAAQECSTEKANNSCTITIDRAYPIALPTIQMRPGAKVSVKIEHSLPFEILSLDLQTAQAIAGTDQTAGFVTAVLPNLKGLLVQTQTVTARAMDPDLTVQATDSADMKKYKADKVIFDNDLQSLYSGIQDFTKKATKVYAQINEVLGPIPPALFQPHQPATNGDPPTFQRLPGSVVSEQFPHPWVSSEYDDWRNSMLCELVGDKCPSKAEDSIKALLADGIQLTTALAPCSSSPPSTSNPPPRTLPQSISCQTAGLETDFGNLTQTERDSLPNLLRQLNVVSAVVSADSVGITAVEKDLNNYYVNINLSEPTVARDPMGEIIDPFDSKDAVKMNVHLKKWFGRQVIYQLNEVNEIATPATSVTTTQKKSIVSLTVLYADPVFEVSAGAIFSTLPNRSFSNQTMIMQNPGASPTPENVVISQSITRPTVVLFAGGNWRLGPEHLWPDGRRGAFYLTTTVGINVNNTAAEFGVGPSISWRSLMFSVLYDWGHDVRLTQGEFVGEIWCNMSAANGSIPKCSGPPPSPSTEKYWRGVVAFGISVRVPTIFGGGSSGAPSSGSH